MKNPFWYCNVCHAKNHVLDGVCQYCECQGKDCKRDSCDADAHFAFEPDSGPDSAQLMEGEQT